MSKDIKEIKYTKRDDSVYMFRLTKRVTSDERNEINRIFKEHMPKGSTVILLEDGIEYIPTDNETLMKRLDDVETSLQELISLVDSRTR